MHALQSRMARAATGLSLKEIAQAAKVSTFTLHRLESGSDKMRERTIDDVQRVFEEAGARFIEQDGWIGVMIRKPE